MGAPCGCPEWGMDWGLMGRPLIWPGVRGPLLCPTGIPPGGIPVACPALVAICGYPPGMKPRCGS